MAKVAYHPIEQPVAAEPELRPAAVERAYSILYFGFIVLPTLARLDKFGQHLADWDQYFSPFFANLVGPRAPYFMRIVGVIEIVAGILVAGAPRYGA